MNNTLYKQLPFIIKRSDYSRIVIDCNITQDSKVEFCSTFLKHAGNALFGISDSTHYDNHFLLDYSHFYFGKNYNDFKISLNEKYTFVLKGKGYVEINGSIIHENTFDYNFFRTNLSIAGAYRTGSVQSYHQYFYYCKIYEDGTNLSYHLIPCKRYSDNVVGLYDLINDEFYPPTNGDFTEPFDFTKIKSIKIPEGNVTKLQDKNGKILWTNINKVAYGIRWSTNTGTTCERIGNLELHKTLPIQSKFKVCVHQGTDIKYYCNPDDSRFRENPTILSKDDFEFESCDGLPNEIVCCDEDSDIKYKVVNDIFADYKYLYAYIYITSEVVTCVARIVHIDVATKTAYLNDTNQQDSTYAAISGDINFIVAQGIDYNVELGAVINGYDGEVGIDTGGKFYQWSIDNAGIGNEVWISEYKCVPYAKEVKRHIIGCSRACVLNSAFNDTKWGWIGTLQSNTSVNVINYNSRLRGSSNNSQWDKYLGVDNFRCQFNKGRTNMQLSVMRQYTQKLANHQVLYKQLWEAIVWCWCIEYAQLDVKKAFNSALTTDGYHQGGLGNAYSVNGVDLGNYNNNECFTPCDYTLHLGNKTGIRTRAAKEFSIAVAANHYWNYYNYSRVTATRDSTNKILTITKITTAYPNDWNIYVPGTSVSGKHTYTISGLTDSQTIVFKTKNGNITVTEDGTYEIDWSNNNANRLIAFSKAQTECNIIITIDSAPSSEIIQTQYKWDVPHWRGFNVFWYGDIWLNIENFLSKYDSTKQRRIYYWTDDVTKFDNSIDNKEHSLEDILAPQSNWVNEFNLGNQGSLTPRSYGSAKNVYHWNSTDTQIHTTFAGGQVWRGSYCGLACLNSYNSVAWAWSDAGFATCTIID